MLEMNCRAIVAHKFQLEKLHSSTYTSINRMVTCHSSYMLYDMVIRQKSYKRKQKGWKCTVLPHLFNFDLGQTAVTLWYSFQRRLVYLAMRR